MGRANVETQRTFDRDSLSNWALGAGEKEEPAWGRWQEGAGAPRTAARMGQPGRAPGNEVILLPSVYQIALRFP